MDKDKFLFLLANNASLTEEETSELASLKDQFPYSQPIHNLLARGAQLNNLPTKQSVLTQAAVYATDRTVLKAIITALPAERKVKPEVKKVETIESKPEVKELEKAKQTETVLANKDKKPEVIKTEPVTVKEPVIREPRQQDIEQNQPEPISPKTEFKASELSGDKLIDELFHDLDKLKKLKHDFEVAIEQFDPTLPSKDTTEKDTKVEDKHEPKLQEKKKKIPKGIIAEIKSTKKKIKPSDPKQKEQLDIIDQFIKSKPSIGKNKDTPPSDTTDLAENSGVFTDNIVSETLVEILIKQGKKEKAIEVLRKLIWKFPQKKAYFAAQIEELTS